MADAENSPSEPDCACRAVGEPSFRFDRSATRLAPTNVEGKMTCRAFFLAAAMLVAAAPPIGLFMAAPAWAAPAKIKAGKIKAGISGEDWGTTQKGDKVRLFTLTGKGGMVARITNFGGVVVDLMVPDRHGKPVNVVLGYDDFASYEKGGVYSALIGRYANRLSFKFLVDGKIYEQPAPRPYAVAMDRPAPAGSAPPGSASQP